MFCCCRLLFPLLLLLQFAHSIVASDGDDGPVANLTAAKKLFPPEPTDKMPVTTAYFNPKTYSVKDFQKFVVGLNEDIKNGFKKVDEENGRMSEAIVRLDGRMDKLEDWKWMERTGLANWPCLLLAAMAILLLSIALLVLCNTLLIKRVLGGAATAVTANSSARREKGGGGGRKEREMVGLVQKEVV